MKGKRLLLIIIQMTPKLIRRSDPTANKSVSVTLKHLMTWRNVAKFVVVVCSFSGFFYQSSEYIIDFFQYSTVVEVNIDRSQIIDIPSFTICVPTLATRSRLNALYPVILQEIIHIQSNKDSKMIPALIRKVYQTYENLSAFHKPAPQFFELGFRHHEIIECKVLRPLYYANITWIPCENVSQVLETMGPNGKCFTYFSLLNESESVDMKKFKIDTNQGIRNQAGQIVNILITFDSSNYTDATKLGDESITLHEPTAVPTEGKRRRLKPGTNYDIFFTKAKTISLPAPYQTKCFSYPLFNYTEPQSRIDCVDRCIKEIFYKECECYPLHVVARYDLLVNHNFSACNESSPPLDKCLQKEMENQCYQICPIDCEEVSYDFDTEEDQFPNEREINEAEEDEREKLLKFRNVSAQIRLWRKISGDTFYIHTPRLPRIQLFSFIGGLASLWLGISIIAFYDILVNVVTTIYKTKPFEKMRKRDAAASVLSNWATNKNRVSVANAPSTTRQRNPSLHQIREIQPQVK